MTIEADLYALLQARCTRVYPDVAPVDTTMPYVTYQGIGGQSIKPLGRELPSKRNTVVQINVWAQTRQQCNALMRQIEDAMRMTTVFSAQPQAEPISDYDHDMQRYGAMQDFSIWADR